MFDQFDRIRIVNLKHRKDRRVEMLRELRRVGLRNDPRVAFVEAFSFPDAGGFRGIGSHGNFHTQLRILEEAANAGESVLILEDDCDFTLGAEAYALPWDCDVFYGSYQTATPNELENGDVIGSHFMGFSKPAARAAAVYLRSLLQPNYAPDPRAAAEPTYRADIRPSIDGAYVWFRRAHPEMKTIFATPALGHQRASRSDCAQVRFFDALPVLRQAATYARTMKRELERLAQQRPTVWDAALVPDRRQRSRAAL